MTKKVLVILLLISAVSLAACGKHGNPEPLEDSPYKRTYPKPT